MTTRRAERRKKISTGLALLALAPSVPGPVKEAIAALAEEVEITNDRIDTVILCMRNSKEDRLNTIEELEARGDDD
jgi:hypothetical protein